ncbi:MAG: hypothetical protein V2B20_28610 [Pseudomonadota bacterium]
MAEASALMKIIKRRKNMENDRLCFMGSIFGRKKIIITAGQDNFSRRRGIIPTGKIILQVVGVIPL